MDLSAARALAEKHMWALGLDDWQIRFRASRTVAGHCSSTNRTITFSKELTHVASEAEFLDTVLHEIAHAVVGCSKGHGPEWRAYAVSIGCSGERCHDRVLTDAEWIEAKAACAAQVAPAAVVHDLLEFTAGPVCTCHFIELTAAGECAVA